MPRELTIDNGTQFNSKVFKEFCMQIGTKLCFASVRHPQSNGLIERANSIILQGISRRLHGRPKGKWAEELTSVIWSHNNSESRATKFTPLQTPLRRRIRPPRRAQSQITKSDLRKRWNKHPQRRTVNKRPRRRTQMPSSQQPSLISS